MVGQAYFVLIAEMNNLLIKILSIKHAQQLISLSISSLDGLILRHSGCVQDLECIKQFMFLDKSD